MMKATTNTRAEVAQGFREYRMSKPSHHRARWTCALALMVCLTTTAQAQHVKGEERKRESRVGSVKFLPGSQESEAARAKRLKRECRGRPNAGACLGHAS